MDELNMSSNLYKIFPLNELLLPFKIKDYDVTLIAEVFFPPSVLLIYCHTLSSSHHTHTQKQIFSIFRFEFKPDFFLFFTHTQNT
jgi:hypothetical protein